MSYELTAKGSGYYRVYVDGVQVSQHSAEREAAEAAMREAGANPAAAVYYDHDYTVVVERPGPAPAPAPSPEPAPAPAPSPAPPPSGAPVPPPVGAAGVLVDTRAGAAQSIQRATALAEALGAIGHGAYAYPSGDWAWTADMDGQRTRAFVCKWRDWRGVSADQGRKLGITFAARPREVYVQHKVWKGRLRGDGVDHGAIDSFVQANGEPGANPTANGKIFRAIGTVWGGGAEVRATSVFNGPEPFNARVSVNDNRVTRFFGGPWNNAHIAGVDLIITHYLRCESAQDAGDGAFGLWIEREGFLPDGVLAEGVNHGCPSYSRFQFPDVLRDPAQDQSEYFWDIVAWAP